MMDWMEVEERIREDDGNKWDRETAAAELRLTDDGVLEVSGRERLPEGFTLSELATGPACGGDGQANSLCR